jgi:hypothetical protein
VQINTLLTAAPSSLLKVPAVAQEKVGPAEAPKTPVARKTKKQG